ncbi:MAG TPA: ATP-binding protein, partial [Blastocatellia bacterium]|nr:ATP-binding protein [Blastocatellia bacterium]
SLRLSRANLAAAALQGAASGRPTGLSCCEVMTLSGGFKECLIEQAIRLRHSIVREATPKLAGRPFLFTIEPTYSRNGSAMGAIVIASDLTAIKHAEAEAQKQREFLSSLVEIAHDAIVVLDGKGKLSWSNLRLSELSGYRWDELRGKRLSELITVDEAGPSLVRLESPSELPESFEARLVREDGTSRYVLVTTTPILDSGRFSGVLGILHDITGVKNSAEKAAQTEKLRALGQLAGGVAHNFNNLLAAVLGHAQLLKRHLTAHPLAGHVELIERAAMDGAAMVRRINSFSLRGSEESFAVTELSGVVRDSLEMTRIRWQDDARAQGLSYQIDFHPVEPETVLGSASELREVFVDMIFNALDAMSSKGGRLTIETGHDATGAYVRFADEGVGMSAGVIEHVFDPFFTTKGAAGTGLGLSGSYAIVERHGGRIEVESQPGRGATFTVRVPRCGAATDMQVQRKDEDQEGTGVLILDDDGELGEKLASVINSWGVDAILTRRSGHALEKLQTGCYAVALISLHLPEGNLSALADEIRSIAPTTKVLIIADSAVSIRGTGRSPSNIGAIITRPFKEETVLLALERALLDA